MKVAGPQVIGILRDPGRFTGILLYGEDAGLVRERALQAARVIVASLDDPFRSCVLTKDEHSRLIEEVHSLSMVGGRRVVRVVDATDALAGPATRVEASPASALVILEAGSLMPRSKLRAMAEKAPHWASIACYPETGPAVAADIRHTIKASGLTVTDDAVAFLTRELGADTTTRRSELEKLVLFVGPAGIIDLEAAEACCARVVEASVDLLLGATLRGDVRAATGLLGRVVDDGVTGPGLIVMLSMRAHRILKVQMEMQQGRSGEEVVRSLLPPVFFRDQPALLREAQLWHADAIGGLLADCRSADIACKQAGSRDTTIASQLFLVTTRRASRLNRRS